GDNSSDGVPPDAPFSTTPFTVNPAIQTVSFTPDSVSISHPEGDSGVTLYTFTVERTGASVPSGDLAFSGIITPTSVDAADFGGVLPPTFSGTILDGQSTAQVTIAVTGDTLFETDETFTLTLQNVSNATEGALLGSAVTATGTIVNDDAPE